MSGFAACKDDFRVTSVNAEMTDCLFPWAIKNSKLGYVVGWGLR
jgi:hypothetical protein